MTSDLDLMRSGLVTDVLGPRGRKSGVPVPLFSCMAANAATFCSKDCVGTADKDLGNRFHTYLLLSIFVFLSVSLSLLCL